MANVQERDPYLNRQGGETAKQWYKRLNHLSQQITGVLREAKQLASQEVNTAELQRRAIRDGKLKSAKETN